MGAKRCLFQLLKPKMTKMTSYLEEWQKAQTANLAATSSQDHTKTYATFALENDKLLIFSMQPDKDYEVNFHAFNSWRMLFMINDEIIGYAEYERTLSALKPYILATENNSILVQQLTSEQIEDIFNKAGGIYESEIS